MPGRVFRYQGWLWRALNTLTDILALSVLWLLCSIPVLTLGAATTALYDSVVRCIRYKQSGPYERFFRTFKNELVPGLLLTLLFRCCCGFTLPFHLVGVPQCDADHCDQGQQDDEHSVVRFLTCHISEVLRS